MVPVQAQRADNQESPWNRCSPKSFRPDGQEKLVFQFQSEGGEKPMSQLEGIQVGGEISSYLRRDQPVWMWYVHIFKGFTRSTNFNIKIIPKHPE